MITIDENKCPQNHRCPAIAICNVGAITQNGFGLPVINQKLCVGCGRCIKFCPKRAIQKTV